MIKHCILDCFFFYIYCILTLKIISETTRMRDEFIIYFSCCANAHTIIVFIMPIDFIMKRFMITQCIIRYFVTMDSCFIQCFYNIIVSLTVVSIFSLPKSLKTLIISMLLSFFIVKFVKINVLIWANVCYNGHRR